MGQKDNLPKLAKDREGNLLSWRHPGGKLLRMGSSSLTDAELLAIVIGAGIKGKSALQISEDILHKFQSFKGMSGQDFEEFLKIKGLNKVKCTRLAAVWEIAGRIVRQVLAEREK